MGDQTQNDPRAMLALRFVGGNHTATPREGRSARDGYGALVEMSVGGVPIVREHRVLKVMQAADTVLAA